MPIIQPAWRTSSCVGHERVQLGVCESDCSRVARPGSAESDNRQRDTARVSTSGLWPSRFPLQLLAVKPTDRTLALIRRVPSVRWFARLWRSQGLVLSRKATFVHNAAGDDVSQAAAAEAVLLRL